MSFYFIFNIILTLGTSFWLIKIYFTERYLLVKPSIVLLAYTHIFFQWPMALLPGYYEKSLKQPYILSFLISGYMLCGLLISPFILRKKAQIIWNRLGSKSGNLNSEYYYSIIFLFFIISFTSIIYLSYLPFNKTGLYAIFFNPSESAIARENSLKLLDSTLIKYLYSIVRSSITPLLFSLVFLKILTRKRSIYFSNIIIYFEISILIFSALFSSLTGERSFLTSLILLGGLVILWEHKLKFDPLKIFLILICAVIPPTMFSFFREGGSFENFNILYLFLYVYYLGDILERFFVVPFKVGVWYVKYAQDVGPFGVAALVKIAKLFGMPHVNAPNIIGLKYAPEFYAKDGYHFGVMLLQKVLDVFNFFTNRLLTVKDDILALKPFIKASNARANISAGAGYLLSYYGYLGIFSFPLSLLGLFALDVALLFYTRIKDIFLVPCLASISLICLSFIQADYTVTWVTHGFGSILLLAWGLSKCLEFVNKRFVWKSYGQPKEA